MKNKNKKMIPKGKIEIKLANKVLGDKEVPGKEGSFESAADAADFFECERPRPKRERQVDKPKK